MYILHLNIGVITGIFYHLKGLHHINKTFFSLSGFDSTWEIYVFHSPACAGF